MASDADYLHERTREEREAARLLQNLRRTPVEVTRPEPQYTALGMASRLGSTIEAVAAVAAACRRTDIANALAGQALEAASAEGRLRLAHLASNAADVEAARKVKASQAELEAAQSELELLRRRARIQDLIGYDAARLREKAASVRPADASGAVARQGRQRAIEDDLAEMVSRAEAEATFHAILDDMERRDSETIGVVAARRRFDSIRRNMKLDPRDDLDESDVAEVPRPPKAGS